MSRFQAGKPEHREISLFLRFSLMENDIFHAVIPWYMAVGSVTTDKRKYPVSSLFFRLSNRAITAMLWAQFGAGVMHPVSGYGPLSG
ncbi:hypothetical protein [Dickeya lacustris]|uniref:Uncharacterized protein n=1 Tax=Dickeya lacustris TaxID=2259638 RepID=A0ABY8G8X6_9GAMM|nr:hypothetical protein [Dickeya lacustris]WFN56408.1 hypothetical protein O1Q98_03645 [Dickeya lacustris]